MSRMIAILAAAALCACAAPQKQPADLSQHKVEGMIGLMVVSWPVAELEVAAPDASAGAALDPASEKKRPGAGASQSKYSRSISGRRPSATNREATAATLSRRPLS